MEEEASGSLGTAAGRPHLFPKGMSVMMMSMELVLTGKLHRSQRTVSIGSPHALKQTANSCERQKLQNKSRENGQIGENASILTCLFLPSASGCGRCC